MTELSSSGHWLNSGPRLQRGLCGQPTRLTLWPLPNHRQSYWQASGNGIVPHQAYFHIIFVWQEADGTNADFRIGFQHSIDGYLATICIAPKLIKSDRWLTPVLNAVLGACGSEVALHSCGTSRCLGSKHRMAPIVDRRADASKQRTNPTTSLQAFGRELAELSARRNEVLIAAVMTKWNDCGASNLTHDSKCPRKTGTRQSNRSSLIAAIKSLSAGDSASSLSSPIFSSPLIVSVISCSACYGFEGLAFKFSNVLKPKLINWV